MSKGRGFLALKSVIKTDVVVVMPTVPEDVDTIVLLEQQAWGDMASTQDQMFSRLHIFSLGQLCAYINRQVVGYISTIRIDTNDDLSDIPETYQVLTGSGLWISHIPDGNTLFCTRITVDKKYQGLGIARKLIEKARATVDSKKIDVSKVLTYSRTFYGDYCEKVRETWPEQYFRETLDPVIAFHQHLGAEVVKILKDVVEGDKISRGVFVVMKYPVVGGKGE